MIKIIKLGSKDSGIYTFTCIDCHCEFTFTDDDIGEIAEVRGQNVIRQYGVKCPCCGKYISSEEIKSYAIKSEKYYTADDVYNKKAFEDYTNDLKKEVETITDVPNIPSITYQPNLTPVDNMQPRRKCEDCPFQKRLQSGEPYIGDSPCQWCSANPYKITCDNSTNGITSSYTSLIKESK